MFSLSVVLYFKKNVKQLLTNFEYRHHEELRTFSTEARPNFLIKKCVPANKYLKFSGQPGWFLTLYEK